MCDEINVCVETARGVVFAAQSSPGQLHGLALYREQNEEPSGQSGATIDSLNDPKSANQHLQKDAGEETCERRVWGGGIRTLCTCLDCRVFISD